MGSVQFMQFLVVFATLAFLATLVTPWYPLWGVPKFRKLVFLIS